MACNDSEVSIEECRACLRNPKAMQSEPTWIRVFNECSLCVFCSELDGLTIPLMHSSGLFYLETPFVGFLQEIPPTQPLLAAEPTFMWDAAIATCFPSKQSHQRDASVVRVNDKGLLTH